MIRTRRFVSGLRRPRPGVAIGIGVLVVASATGAYAAIPGGDGQVKGCYAVGNSLLGLSYSKGDTRIVDETESCRSYEKTIKWSQIGPKGNTGAQGIQGIKGDTGAQGVQGVQGLKGDTGPQGLQGSKGDTGAQGFQGAPGISTATFASGGDYIRSDTLTKMASKNLPAGSWAIVATVNTSVAVSSFAGDRTLTEDCQLRNGAGVIGATSDRRTVPSGQVGQASLSLNGGAQVPPGGGEVSLWCRNQLNEFMNGQMMMMQVGGFS